MAQFSAVLRAVAGPDAALVIPEDAPARRDRTHVAGWPARSPAAQTQKVPRRQWQCRRAWILVPRCAGA